MVKMRVLTILTALCLLGLFKPCAATGDLPSCALKCWETTNPATYCKNKDCLCEDRNWQTLLYKCLYSQCGNAEAGVHFKRSLSHCGPNAGLTTIMTATLPGYGKRTGATRSAEHSPTKTLQSYGRITDKPIYRRHIPYHPAPGSWERTETTTSSANPYGHGGYGKGYGYGFGKYGFKGYLD